VPPAAGAAPSARLRGVLLATLAAMLGAVPFLLFVDLLPFLPLVGAIAAVVAALSVRKLELPSAEPPTTGEWLLGGWSLVFVGSLISGEGFLLYGLLYGGTRAVERLAGLAGWTLDLGAGTIALVGSAFVAAMVVGMAGHGAKELLEKLHPRVAGTRSPFFPLASRPQTALLVAAGLVLGVAVALWWLDPRGLAFTVGLTLALLYSGLPLAQLGERTTPRDEARLAGAVERLLAAAGYRVTRSPVTGNAEVDPLLAQVDYFAQAAEPAAAGARSYAVDVKVASGDNDSVDWTTASELRTAARALQATLQPAQGEGVRVDPLLVMVGGRSTEALRRFAAEEGVRLVHIKDALPLKQSAAMAPGRLRELALELLGIGPGGAPVAPAAMA
jgi:uncharacterized membrane protein YjjB (DUF3815 family)